MENVGGSLLAVELPGLAVVALSLGDRTRWPGFFLAGRQRKGRGVTVTVEAEPLAWRALLVSLEGGPPEGASQSERAACAKAAQQIVDALKEEA